MSKEILLEVNNIKKNYGEINALKGVDLEVEKGEVVVILGHSGYGKSTFLRCLNDLENINEGEIILKNYPNIELVKFEHNTEAFAELKDGRGAALTHDNTLLFAWDREN